MSRISIKVGPPVEGDDFYGREKELSYAWESHISKGTSLLLSAPRRVGKSSFSKKILKIAEKNKWKTLYLDLEGISTEQEFVKSLKDELQKNAWWENTKGKIGDTILKILEGIDVLEIAGSKVSFDSTIWRANTYENIKQLFEKLDETLIVIDELAVYLNHLLAQESGKEKVEFFLEWLRKFRQTTRSRWILCSSIGIENFASMHQLSKHINDIKPFSIGAFREDEAEKFILRLGIDENVLFTSEHIQYILDKLVWHLPFFIQLLVEKIKFLICVEDKHLSNETIDEAYNRLVTEGHFNTWDERLKEYGELEADTRKILKLCTFPKGKSRKNLLANLSVNTNDIEKIEETLSRILVLLKNDGYLEESNDKYIFRSPLLRDFWYGRFGK